MENRSLTIQNSSLLLIAALIWACTCSAKILSKTGNKLSFGRENRFLIKSSFANADSITLINGNSTFTVDSFTNYTIIKQYKVALRIKLKSNSNNHKDTTKLTLFLKSLQPLQNMQLYKDSIDNVIIKKTDWKVIATPGTNDTLTVVDTVTVTVKQIAQVNTEQNIILSLYGVSGNYILRFMPYAAKSKTTNLYLVKNGHAEIVVPNKAKKISRYYASKVSSIDTVSVRLRINGPYDPWHNQLIFQTLDTSLSKQVQIIENPLTIGENEWKEAEKTDGIITVPLHIKTINISDSVYVKQDIELVLQGQTQVSHGTQKINLNVKDKSFWAEVGTNFDLLDNIKTNNFYAGVYVFDKDIARIGGRKGEDNISFTAGVYESQSISLSASSNNLFSFRDGNSYVNSNNSYPLYRDTGSIKTVTTVKSIGMLLSPHLRLTNGRVDENGVHLFISFYAEMLWQRITTNFDYSKTAPLDTLHVDQATSLKSPYKGNGLNLDYRSQYYGIGIPFYLKHRDFNLYINWIPIGFTTQQFVFVQNSYAANYNNNSRFTPIPVTNNNPNYDLSLLNYAQPRKGWNKFFIVQYRLNEVAYGLTFSGEIRSLYLEGSKPVITLALSKKFDLTALLKPLLASY